MIIKAEFIDLFIQNSELRPEIGIECSLINPYESELKIHNIIIEIVRLIVNSSKYLDIFNPKIIMSSHIIHPGNKARFKIYFGLSLLEIDKIEEKRNKDLILEIWNSKCIFQLQSDFREESFDIVNNIGSRNFSIPRSRWIDYINQTKYKNLKIFELPILDNSPFEKIESIYVYLDKASKNFLQGDFENVLGDCRKSIEEFREIYPHESKNEIEPFKETFRKYLGSESKAKIIDNMIGEVRHFSNKGHHIGSVISRKDAELCLQLTLELFRFIGRVVNEQKT